MGRRERPLDPDQGVLQRFASELRQLRESAGAPSYRELAKRARYSVTALSEAAGGQLFPSLRVTLAYVKACGGDPDIWRELWENACLDLMPNNDGDDPEKAPYLGLASFQPEDADRFFGRRALLEDVCARLAESPFLAVFGTSGSGKSSLLRAGLLPAVWRGDIQGSDDWPTVLLTPGSRPLEQLAVYLADLGGVSPASKVTDPDGIHVLLRQVLTKRAETVRLTIVVDQFEEIFTLCREEDERRRFVECLLAAAGEDGQARVVLGVRADFYARCAQYPALVTALRDRQVLVGPMDADDLRSVVREPAVRAGLTVENALVEAVVADTADEPGALPLMSHALVETWKRRSGDRMTLAAYRQAGGVRGAIARTADRVFDEFDPDEQLLARDVFLRLTAFGEGTEDTRRRVARSELLDRVGAESMAKVLARLAEERLVTLGSDTVEVAHEALIRSWPRLRAWLAEDREALSAHRRLTETVADWERHDRDDGLLYRGARLTAWQDDSLERFNDAEREFLSLSFSAADRERRGRRRRTRVAFGFSVTATAVVTVLAVLAMMLAGRNAEERELAYSRQLIADARAQGQRDPELGLLLTREAYRIRPGAETEAALRQAAVDSRVRASLTGHQGKITGVAFAEDGRQLVTSGADGALRVWEWTDGHVSSKPPVVLRGHQGEAWSPVFSWDGSRIAAAGVDGMVSVWDVRSGTAVLLRGHQDAVWAVSFSQDGQRVASAGQDGTIRVWRADGSGEPDVLKGHNGRVLGVAFSPDGRSLASSGGDGTVRIWSMDGAGPPIVLTGHRNSVEMVQFSPDGRHVATASTDGTARLWDVRGHEDPVVLGTHEGTAEGIAFSPDGRWLASTGDDGTIRVWSIRNRAFSTVLRGHRGTVWAATFSRDGKSLVSASDDGTARVWDLEETEDVVMDGHTGPVCCAAFSPDGTRVASAGKEDGTLRVWDSSGRTDPMVLSGGGPMTDITWSPDGTRVAGVAKDSVVRVWQVDGRTDPMVLPSLGDPAPQATFSPDSRRIAVANGKDVINIWNVTGTGGPTELRAKEGGFLYVAWSPDGGRMAASTLSGVIVVWDLAGRGEPVVLRGHLGPVWQLAFSPDSTRVASAGNDGTTRVWRVTGTGDPSVLTGHQGLVWSVTFTQDGRYLITSGNDSTARRWALDRPGESLVFREFRASVESATTTTDGRYLTAHGDGTVRVWRCPACGPIDKVLADVDHHVTRGLTADERRIFLGR
ncbi:WD40 repeat protein [Kibdelosporangium banguiense]|uniref:WD40 repeat protein n=1 Tax=Kibdelosporangium banguiense TaxID=1365924 RepID=A0ABS4TWR7_9PSEU|nr:PD40 domain-containing protein [Kibdelosporangium banguiense]MBP2328813.1 WD40 repeat protein [Kibdelosporangium banguiense]